MALLLGFSVSAGASLGLIALLADWLYHDIEFPSIAFSVLATALVGGFVGLVSSPFVMLCLWRKDFRLALPTVYSASAAVAVVSTMSSFSLAAALPVCLTLCASSALLAFVLPSKVHEYAPGCCPECGYDLRGAVHARCPECGWRREATS